VSANMISTGVKLEPFDDKRKFTRFPQASPEGGLAIPDEDNALGVMMEVMKKLGPKISDGTFDLSTLPRPAKVCSHLSLLETIANDLILCTPYLNQAAACTDPMKRVKYVAAFIIGSWHANVFINKKGGYDPILGETFAARKEDGTEYYAEYICNKPKTTLYSLIGPGKTWWAHGWARIDVSMGVNTMEAQKAGKTTIYFKDGTEIQFTNPGVKVDGVMMGKRVLNMQKKPFIVDKKNSLMGEIYFNFENVDSIKDAGKKHKKYWFEDPSKKPSDYLALLISKYTKDPKTNEVKKDFQSFGSGSWLEYLQVDNEVYWRIDDPLDLWKCDPEDEILPSHCRNRPDVPYAREKEFDKADVEKEKLATQQALDEKLRAAKVKK